MPTTSTSTPTPTSPASSERPFEIVPDVLVAGPGVSTRQERRGGSLPGLGNRGVEGASQGCGDATACPGGRGRERGAVGHHVRAGAPDAARIEPGGVGD